MPALYYPFHLCHERTLHQLLGNYEAVHFRDFMALQLTPLMGTTAFPDRMGDYYPELLQTGRIVQGHHVSGPMSTEMIGAVNRDLADASWRSIFQQALQSDYRFQRGLFDVSQLPKGDSSESGETSILFEFRQEQWVDKPYTVDTVRSLCPTALSPEIGPSYEYGWAMIKTAAALRHTIRLCRRLALVAATDSASHARLLARTCDREHLDLTDVCVSREGY